MARDQTSGLSGGERGEGRILDRETYRKLTVRRDGLAATLLLLRIAFHAALLAGASLLFARGQTVAALLLLIPHFVTWSFLGWAGVGHELFHRSVFSVRWLNTALFRLFSILTWSNYGYFEVTHPIHHRNTLGEGDFEADPQGRLSPLGTLALLTIDLGALYRRVRVLALNAAGVAPGGAMAAIFPAGSDAFLKLRNGARAVIVGQALLIATCLWLGSPFLAAALTLAPFCMTFVNRTLAALQHFDLRASGVPGDYESSTRTVILGPVAGFFYADMNYHIEHHHFPSIPHYNLRKAHAAVTARRRPLHLERGYWRGLRLLARKGFFTSGRPLGA